MPIDWHHYLGMHFGFSEGAAQWGLMRLLLWPWGGRWQVVVGLPPVRLPKMVDICWAWYAQRSDTVHTCYTKLLKWSTFPFWLPRTIFMLSLNFSLCLPSAKNWDERNGGGEEQKHELICRFPPVLLEGHVMGMLGTMGNLEAHSSLVLY